MCTVTRDLALYFDVATYDMSYSSPYNAAQTVCQHILYMLHLQVIPRIRHKKNFEYKVRKVSARGRNFLEKRLSNTSQIMKFINR